MDRLLHKLLLFWLALHICQGLVATKCFDDRCKALGGTCYPKDKYPPGLTSIPDYPSCKNFACYCLGQCDNPDCQELGGQCIPNNQITPKGHVQSSKLPRCTKFCNCYVPDNNECEDPKCTDSYGGLCLSSTDPVPAGYSVNAAYPSCNDNCRCYVKDSKCEDPKCTSTDTYGGLCLSSTDPVPAGYSLNAAYPSCNDNCRCYVKDSKCEDPKCTSTDSYGGLCLSSTDPVPAGYDVNADYPNCLQGCRCFTKKDCCTQVNDCLLKGGVCSKWKDLPKEKGVYWFQFKDLCKENCDCFKKQTNIVIHGGGGLELKEAKSSFVP